MLSFDRAEPFFECFSQVTTDIELADLLDSVTREMGFAYFALTLEACAGAFGRERLGHARWPPGHSGRKRSQARFSRLGVALGDALKS